MLFILIGKNVGISLGGGVMMNNYIRNKFLLADRNKYFVIVQGNVILNINYVMS